MPYIENRVTTKYYGTIATDSPLLVPVPTTPGHAEQRLHACAAQGLGPLSDAAKTDLGFDLVGASGWRPHRWSSWDDYVTFVTKRYGSLQEGRKYLAFDSPHETGLALDFGCGGLMPVSATIPTQKQTPLFKWLVENAWKFGWTPYMVEPWHWEFHITLDEYTLGSMVSTPTTPEEGAPLPICEDDSMGMCIEAPHDWVMLK
jgi:hypothetical protein